jgi:T4 RnlA family RNA ligase
MEVNKALLDEMIQAGYVVSQKHPSEDLFIYNYTATAQYERVWNEVTLQCRGLILDKNYRIVARPFVKFFNWGEMEGQIIPEENFEVYEKLDGSLGILYWWNDEAYIATRGSFVSDQASKANQILKRKYAHVLRKLDGTKTYLFEIIYPENRIVVDYSGMEDLVLIAITCNKTGKECELQEIGFTLVKRYNGIKDICALAEMEENNREGFVVKFSNGLRYKIKFKEYLRVHKIVSQVSTIAIWELLRAGKLLEEVLDRVPDEFYNWVKKTNGELLDAYRTVEDQAKEEYKILDTRKETALYFQSCKYPGIMFNIMDGKDYSDTIWRMLRPKYTKPFKVSDEE